MKKLLLNAFSLQMLEDVRANVKFYPASKYDALSGDLISYVGHEDLAIFLGVPFNRKPCKIKVGDTVYIAQYMGGRLPDGSTQLPDFSTVEFVKVVVEYPNLSILSGEVCSYSGEFYEVKPN